MITIIFESHATTVDNEAKLAAGWNDVALSTLGEEQAKQLGERYAGQQFDAILCSDLQRSYKTAQLAFGDTYQIIQDARLRECNYGSLNGAPKSNIEAQRLDRITTPFPDGESYQDTDQRMHNFLLELAQRFDGKRVMIIGHRATQYGLEHWLKGISIEQAVTASWQWQPGWQYKLTSAESL